MASAPRIVGVDIARGVAILGMFAAHAIPRADEAEILADGRSSVLFATLAGVSLGLMTGAERPTGRPGRGDAIVGIVMRALLLFLLGVGLALSGSRIAIILDYYGVMFLLLVPMLFLPRWINAAIGAVLIVAAPLLASSVGDQESPLAEVAVNYLLIGYYPALVWLPFLIAGLIAARSGLRKPRTQAWLVGGGALASLAGYGAAAWIPGVSAEAHSGSTAEVLGSGGLAIAVVGALLWATSRSRVVRTVLWPVGATGSMALTVYTAQILVLAAVVANFGPGTATPIDYPGWPLLIWLSAGSIVVASVWKATLGRGPLERVMSRLTTAPGRRSGRRA